MSPKSKHLFKEKFSLILIITILSLIFSSCVSNKSAQQNPQNSSSQFSRNIYAKQGTASKGEEKPQTFNSWLEDKFQDIGQARFNFSLANHKRISGQGDLLLPLYDSESSTLYTQLGLRNAWEDRWQANVGLGQRWFFDNSWALGYNAFFDYDIVRRHSRGGLGAEFWMDWVRVAVNAYMPLSGWRKSPDISNTEERPAKGWDANIKTYLPNYRQLAFTAGFAQWYGDDVGIFGHKGLEDDPKIWSYGVEYTPVPLISFYAKDQRSHRGQSNFEAGAWLTWRFGQSLSEQVSSDKMNQLRTIDGSRHQFADRNNQIVLEYRTKIEPDSNPALIRSRYKLSLNIDAATWNSSSFPGHMTNHWYVNWLAPFPMELQLHFDGQPLTNATLVWEISDDPSVPTNTSPCFTNSLTCIGQTITRTTDASGKVKVTSKSNQMVNSGVQVITVYLQSDPEIKASMVVHIFNGGNP